MGIFEQLLEDNKQLLKKVNIISSEIDLLKEAVKNNCKQTPKDELVLRFSNEDTMNFAITAKILGIRQRELQVIMEAGILTPVGTRKRNFRAKDVIDYMKNENNPISHPGAKVKKRNEPNAIISNKDMAELLEINKKA